MLRREHSTAFTARIIAFCFVALQATGASPAAPKVCTSSPVLHLGRAPWLDFGARAKSRILLQREWLVPTADVKQEEEGAYVSSFQYDPTTTCFEVGNGTVVIHASSFATQGGGSAAAAAGRDMFFLIDLRSNKVIDHLDLGISKQRLRTEGCFHAMMAHFVAADINHDGQADLGVVGEEIACESKDRKPGNPIESASPIYQQHRVVWYVTSTAGWKRADDHEGELPSQYLELPLIGMMFSPVDFVATVLWQASDSHAWPHTGTIAFVPEYRRVLVQHSTDQQKGGLGSAASWVEMAYCGAKPQKPPLKKLYFRVTFHNRSAEPRWVVLPSTIFSAHSHHQVNAGISGMELLGDEHGTKLVRFLGTAPADRDDLNEGGGFQAILLGPNADVTTDVAIDYWGRPKRPLAITALVARGMSLDGKPIRDYFHVPLQTGSSSAADRLRKVDTWTAPSLIEVPFAVQSMDRHPIPDVLAKTCQR